VRCSAQRFVQPGSGCGRASTEGFPAPSSLVRWAMALAMVKRSFVCGVIVLGQLGAGEAGAALRSLQQTAPVCDLSSSGQSAMMACCPAGSIGGGHRLLQSVSCDLPPACPSSRCAEGFASFMSTCGETMSAEWGSTEPLLLQFEAFFGNCQQQFGAELEPQLVRPDDPNLQFIGRFRDAQAPAPPPAIGANLPRYAVLNGCLPGHGYYVITDLAECEAAKAVVEPTMLGVQDGGFGAEWANGCFFNAGTVYFGNIGADHAPYTRWSASHQALCSSQPPAPEPAPMPEPMGEFAVMAGCDSGYQVITSVELCEEAKAALVPTLSGVQEGGFGTEWSNGCFFNGDRVYYHNVGVDHDAYTRWSSVHQALCVIGGPEPAPEPELPAQFLVLSGCRSVRQLHIQSSFCSLLGYLEHAPLMSASCIITGLPSHPGSGSLQPGQGRPRAKTRRSPGRRIRCACFVGSFMYFNTETLGSTTCLLSSKLPIESDQAMNGRLDASSTAGANSKR
jgi:hypothetical protein